MTERPIDESSSLESPTMIKACFVDALKGKPRKGRKDLQKWQNNILEQIEKFLKREDFDVNFCEGEISQSTLWQATMRFEIFNQVLERKETDVKLSDGKHRTAMFLAVESNELQIMESLRKAGALIEWKDNEGRTPLSLAAELGHLECVEFLLANAADVNHRDLHRRTPLLMAVNLDSFQAKKQIIINLLIERGANPNLADDEEKTPLTGAVLQSDIATVKQLLDSKYLATNRTPLAWAIEKGNYWATIELLEDNRTDVHHPNPHGRTPFSLAAGDMRVAIMQLLIRHRAKPHREDNDHHTGFWWFLKARSHSAFKQFLENKDVHPNLCDKTAGTFARTPVIWAAEKHHESLVRLMIDKRKDDFSLNYVIRHSKVYERELGEERMLNTVKTLFSQGEAGDSWITERCGPEGTKPLHLACCQGNDKIVDILIENRVGLNSKDRTGRTPLQYALQQKHEEIARRLLKLMSKLQFVQSGDWFKVADQETYWVKVFQKATSGDFDWDLIPKPKCDFLLCKEQRTLYLCAQENVWSRVPRQFDAEDDMNSEMAKSEYIQYMQRFPGLRVQDPWGVAWIRGPESKDKVNVFLSRLSGSILPNGCIPSSDFEIIGRFLKHLKNEWNTTCSVASMKIDGLRANQVTQKGRNPEFIDELANNASIRMKVRKCLRSHIDRLRCEVKSDHYLNEEKQSKLTEIIDGIESSASKSLDDMERAVRELLQMELARVSRNEAASIKRLSWVTFIFLPLMFASSLFGMNVDLLKDNPDWRWKSMDGVQICPTMDSKEMEQNLGKVITEEERSIPLE
ncbi:hypothetical protein N7467_004895 [Penicillium canescens]|nr:hypothetical protein N7467_004895 [Penicillium canescens]